MSKQTDLLYGSPDILDMYLDTDTLSTAELQTAVLNLLRIVQRQQKDIERLQPAVFGPIEHG